MDHSYGLLKQQMTIFKCFSYNRIHFILFGCNHNDNHISYAECYSQTWQKHLRHLAAQRKIILNCLPLKLIVHLIQGAQFLISIKPFNPYLTALIIIVNKSVGYGLEECYIFTISLFKINIHFFLKLTVVCKYIRHWIQLISFTFFIHPDKIVPIEHVSKGIISLFHHVFFLEVE